MQRDALANTTPLAIVTHVITVNIHEAQARLPELVRAVEEQSEVIVITRNGEEVAEMRPMHPVRDLRADPRLRVEFAPGYTPTEPLTEEEWPSSL